jgi:metal-dependent amidase/aminoacylase/carboxypeptidase family protein
MKDTRGELKLKACESIERRKSEIISIAESISHNPETGFKEHNTA